MQRSPSASDAVLIPLNRSEHAYISVGGLIGSILQTYCLRFDGPIDEACMRHALRQVITAFPRMRSRVEPTWLSWRLRILADDEVVDQLFEAAWQVDRGVDAGSLEALEAVACRLLNTPAAIERGLPMRAVFVPHATRPALFFSVEHFVGDGRSMLQMISGMLGVLNGKPIPPQPLESSSMIPAIAPSRLLDWPRCVLASLRHRRQAKAALAQGHVVKLDTRDLKAFTTHGVRYYDAQVSPQALRALAKQLGTTVNTLALAATCQAVLDRSPNDPQALAHVRMSVDLRRYFPKDQAPEFGNFVATFFVTEPQRSDTVQRLQSIDAQVKEGLARFERREMVIPWIPAELPRLVGRKFYAMLALSLRRRDKLPVMSCHSATLGDCSWVNAPDAKVRMVDFYPTAPSNTAFVGQLTLNGRLVMIVGWQNDRMSRDDVDALTRRVDQILQGYVEQGAAMAAAASAAAAAMSTKAVAATPAAQGAHA